MFEFIFWLGNKSWDINSSLCNVMTLMGVSQKLADRFPTYEHLVKAKLLTKVEMEKLREVFLEKTDYVDDIKNEDDDFDDDYGDDD